MKVFTKIFTVLSLFVSGVSGYAASDSYDVFVPLVYVS